MYPRSDRDSSSNTVAVAIATVDADGNIRFLTGNLVHGQLTAERRNNIVIRSSRGSGRRGRKSLITGHRVWQLAGAHHRELGTTILMYPACDSPPG